MRPLRLVNLVVATLVFASCKTPARETSEGAAVLDLEATPSAWFDYFRPARLRQVAESQFRRTKFKVGGDVFGFGVADLVQLGGRSAASVSAIEPGVYLRTDQWRLGADVMPGSVIAGAVGQELPVNLTIVGGREIVYSRPFDDQADALRALPKTPLDLPLDSVRALGMASGDFVSLPVQMGVTLGVARGQRLPNLGVQASAGIFWTGEFRVNVTRLDGTFVRVKVAPSDVRGTFLTADAYARLGLFGYGPFGVVDLDQQAERALGLDVLRLAGRRVVDGDAMVIDYVIDIADEHGARAYDAILKDTLTPKADDIVRRALGSNQSLKFADITLAEALHAYDLNEPASRRRVARVFSGSRQFAENRFSSRLGTKLWRVGSNKSMSMNSIELADERGRTSSFDYVVFSAQRKTSAIFEQARRSHAGSAAAVVRSEGGAAGSVAGMRFDWDFQERQASKTDKSAIAWSLYAILGSQYGSLGLAPVMAGAPSDKLAVRLGVDVGADLFAQAADMARSDPDELEKWLWTAVTVLTPRFEHRQGPRTPAPASSVRDQVRRLMQSSVVSLRTATRNVINGQWEGIKGTTATRVVQSLLSADRDGAAMAARLLRLMYDDESAQEIVPAMLVTLGDLWRVDTGLTVDVSSAAGVVHQAALGTVDVDPAMTVAAAAFDRLNQTGYER